MTNSGAHMELLGNLHACDSVTVANKLFRFLHTLPGLYCSSLFIVDNSALRIGNLESLCLPVVSVIVDMRSSGGTFIQKENQTTGAEHTSTTNNHIPNQDGRIRMHPTTAEQEKRTSFMSVSGLRSGSGRSQRSLKSIHNFSGTINFIPTLGHNLTDWLSFPEHSQHNAILNSITLPFKWLLWTSKGLTGLPPNQNMRQRMCNQAASLGSVAGLFLVVAISGFLVPPSKYLSLLWTTATLYILHSSPQSLDC